MPRPLPGAGHAGHRWVRAAQIATKARRNASGAVLGYVVEGDTPTLDVQLDSGQIIPQCFGERMAVGTRVLGFWVNQGHELAVLNFTEPPVTFDWAWTLPQPDDDSPSGSFLGNDGDYQDWLTDDVWNPSEWLWLNTGGISVLTTTGAVDGAFPVGIGTAIPPEVGTAEFIIGMVGWDAYTVVLDVMLFLGDAIIIAGNINGNAYIQAVENLTYTDDNLPQFDVIDSDSGASYGGHQVHISRTPAGGGSDTYRVRYGDAVLTFDMAHGGPGVVGVAVPWTNRGTGFLSTRILFMTAHGSFDA